VVLTGGPGAGKTAVLELIHHHFCEHVVVLPEAAGIVFGGGFPRKSSVVGRQAAQRAIFRVQRELERLALEERTAAIILCDRGTLDGAAYWPGDSESFFRENETSRGAEMARYGAVIDLRTPLESNGYNHTNALRIESARRRR
jgi:thymidylate kinase